jgi:SAM-dependent methyltransferase
VTELPAYRRLSGPAYHGGFVERYQRLRPRPPEALFEMLVSLAPSRPPEFVVDLGAGTGLSTVPWASRATRVIGIEMNPEMTRLAAAAANVEYRTASAEATGLTDADADVVTCAQSFHWMDRDQTLVEIGRILRPGGVFAAYDYDWPPLIDWEVDAAFLRLIETSGVDPSRPEKADHLVRMTESGRFRGSREIFLHARQVAPADLIAELPLAFGPVARCLQEGATAGELGLTAFQDTVRRRLCADSNVLWWTYRVRLAYK